MAMPDRTSMTACGSPENGWFHPRPHSVSDAAATIMRRCRHSTSANTSSNFQPKVNIFKNIESTPEKFTSDLCPINLLEEKERFLRFGIIPKFVMRGSMDKVEKLTQKTRGEIRSTYLSEAKAIMDVVKRKYGDGAALIKEMYGQKINDLEASDVLANYLSDNHLDGEMMIYYTQDLSCSAKMMWHGPSLRYNKPEARKYTLIIKNSSENNYLRETGIRCLANHEIGTHYFRMVNDGLQPWFSDRKKFQLRSMSTRESISSEEGLAAINTVFQARAKYLWTAALLYYTACMATDMTFRELFDHLAMYVSDKEQRWKHVMRVKRGLRDPSDRGGYGNDQCYFEGAVDILRNLDKIDFILLYSGRICLDELPRVRRLARLDCIKLPKFLKDTEKYKRTLRQIAIVNGLVPKMEKSNIPKKVLLKKPNSGQKKNEAHNFAKKSCRSTFGSVESIPFTRSAGGGRRGAPTQLSIPLPRILRKPKDFMWTERQKCATASHSDDCDSDR